MYRWCIFQSSLFMCVDVSYICSEGGGGGRNIHIDRGA